MKMKWSQRILLKYYRTKIKTLGLVSPEKAAASAFDLFCTPFRIKKGVKIPAIFHQSNPVSIDLNGMTIRGFQWKSELAQAKKVLILHGFSSYSYKFESYVAALLKSGYEVIAFDAPGHGISDGKRINALIYRDCILGIEKQFGPLYAMIAHSLGGLAASLAMEKMENTRNRKLVLIAPATETKRAIENFFALIPAKKAVQQAFEAHIKQLAGEPIEYFSVPRVVRSIAANVLWVHDETDTICTFKDVKPLLSEHLPGTEFYITNGLGHNKIYKESSTRNKIMAFLEPSSEPNFL